MTDHAQNLIAGEWTGERTPSGATRPTRPSVAASPRATAPDVDAAVTAAADAQPGWAALPAPARGADPDGRRRPAPARRTDVAEDLVREEGKTLAEARGEVAGHRRAALLRPAAGGPPARRCPAGARTPSCITRREPLGVVGLITPWNFPIAIPAWKMAPALISGNTVVIKPAELTPLSATHLATRLIEAGLPAGVLNVVHGAGRSSVTRWRDPRVAGGVLHRLHAVGLEPQETSRPPRPGAARDGRQERVPRARRRRPRQAAKCGRGRLRPHRPGLHRDLPGLRHPGHPARSSRPSPRKPPPTPPATA